MECLGGGGGGVESEGEVFSMGDCELGVDSGVEVLGVISGVISGLGYWSESRLVGWSMGGSQHWGWVILLSDWYGKIDS